MIRRLAAVIVFCFSLGADCGGAELTEDDRMAADCAENPREYCWHGSGEP